MPLAFFCLRYSFFFFFFFGKDSEIITRRRYVGFYMFFFFSSFFFFSFFQHVTTSLNKKKNTHTHTHTEKKMEVENFFPAAEAFPSRSSGRLRQNTRPYLLTVSEAIYVVFFGCSLSFVLFFFCERGCGEGISKCCVVVGDAAGPG